MICNIVKVKVAKKSEISDFEDFQTKGEELTFTPSKNVNISYIAPEDNSYIFYIENELGYKKMVEKRITEDEKNMSIEIVQDEETPNKLTITATNKICNIIKMKIALGNDIDLEYFKTNGEEISINEGKEVTANYSVNSNCTINIYVEDEQGYSYMLKKQIIGIDEPEPNQPPEINLSQNRENPKQIDVTVSDKDSYIDEIKWAKGSQEIEYFKTNGTRIGQDSVGNLIKTQFEINEIGDYTVYAKDEEGNEIVKKIEITNIDKEPEIHDTTPPTISTTNENIDENKSVKLSIYVRDTESEISKVKIASGNQEVEYFENNGTTLQIINYDKYAEAMVMISKNGTYTIYAEDEQGNKTIKTINITQIVEPTPDPEPDPEPEPTPDDTISSSKYKIDTNNISRILPNTNLTEFKNNISTEIGYKVVNKTGNEIQNSELIGTGYKLITQTGKEYLLIITGDLSGDGNITITDLSKLRKHILSIELIEESYKKAADINNDNNISLNDVSKMRKVILNIDQID